MICVFTVIELCICGKSEIAKSWIFIGKYVAMVTDVPSVDAAAAGDTPLVSYRLRLCSES